MPDLLVYAAATVPSVAQPKASLRKRVVLSSPSRVLTLPITNPEVKYEGFGTWTRTEIERAYDYGLIRRKGVKRFAFSLEVTFMQINKKITVEEQLYAVRAFINSYEPISVAYGWIESTQKWVLTDMSVTSEQRHAGTNNIKHATGTLTFLQYVEDRLTVPAARKPAKKKRKSPVKYTVKAGDTLSKIASKYETTIKKLMDDNKLKTKKIKAGQVLIIK